MLASLNLFFLGCNDCLSILTVACAVQTLPPQHRPCSVSVQAVRSSAVQPLIQVPLGPHPRCSGLRNGQQQLKRRRSDTECAYGFKLKAPSHNKPFMWPSALSTRRLLRASYLIDVTASIRGSTKPDMLLGLLCYYSTKDSCLDSSSSSSCSWENNPPTIHCRPLFTSLIQRFPASPGSRRWQTWVCPHIPELFPFSLV